MTETPEISMTTKHLCQQKDFVKIHEEWLLMKNIKHKEIHAKEPHQLHCQLSSTTVTNTTIKKSKNKIYVAF